MAESNTELITEEQKMQQYLKDKMNDLADKLGDGYGEPLLNELIRRLEKTISEFDTEVTGMITDLKEKSEQRRLKLQDLMNAQQQAESVAAPEQKTGSEIPAEISAWEKKLESKSSHSSIPEEKTGPPEKAVQPKKKKLFGRKKK